MVPDADRRLIVGNLADADEMVGLMSSLRIDAMMHFAAPASVPDSIASPEGYDRVNMVVTKNVLDAMRTALLARCRNKR